MQRLTFGVTQFASAAVQYIVCHTAHLCTSTAVGTPAHQPFGHIATPGVAYAYRAVNEHLQFNRLLRIVSQRGLTYSTNLVDAEFACQYSPPETHALQCHYLFGCAVVTLRGGVQANWRQLFAQQAQVLNDQCIHTGLVQLPRHGCGFLTLGVVHQRVDRNQHLDAKAVGVRSKLAQVVDAVAGCLTRTELRCTDIYSIRACHDSGVCYVNIFCRCK